jgi:hypothetical protein
MTRINFKPVLLFTNLNVKVNDGHTRFQEKTLYLLNKENIFSYSSHSIVMTRYLSNQSICHCKLHLLIKSQLSWRYMKDLPSEYKYRNKKYHE